MSSQQQSNGQTQLQTINVPEGVRYVARVKWFDNKLNFGFATIVHGEHAGKDIFVHQSNILTFTPGIFRTLRPGEYIEMGLEETKPGSAHKYQAYAVTGPHAGLLMCESNPRRPTGFRPTGTASHHSNAVVGTQQKPKQNRKQKPQSVTEEQSQSA